MTGKVKIIVDGSPLKGCKEGITFLVKGDDLNPDTEEVQEQWGPYPSFVRLGHWEIAPDDPLPISERDMRYCIYLAGKFTAAAAAVLYKTGKLTIEMYHL